MWRDGRIHIYVYKNTCTHIYTNIYIYAYRYIFIYVSVHIYLCIKIFVSDFAYASCSSSWDGNIFVYLIAFATCLLLLSSAVCDSRGTIYSSLLNLVLPKPLFIPAALAYVSAWINDFSKLPYSSFHPPCYLSALSWFSFFLPSDSFFHLGFFVFPIPLPPPSAVATSCLGYILRHFILFFAATCLLSSSVLLWALTISWFFSFVFLKYERWSTAFTLASLFLLCFFWRTSCLLMCKGKDVECLSKEI